MNPTVRSKITAAVDSLKVPEPLSVCKVGEMQIDRKGTGDVQAMELGKSRPADPKKIDGNIDADAFERLW